MKTPGLEHGISRFITLRSGVQANDEAEFACVTEDGERLKTQLTVLTSNKRKERKKKEIVIKKVEFNEAASNKLVEDMFADKPIDEFAEANQSEVFKHLKSKAS